MIRFGPKRNLIELTTRSEKYAFSSLEIKTRVKKVRKMRIQNGKMAEELTKLADVN